MAIWKFFFTANPSAQTKAYNRFVGGIFVITLLIISLLIVFSVAAKAQPQYASSVIAFSSQYTATSWSAAQATGAPNVGACGDNSLAWASATADGQREYLVLGFTTAQPVNTIKIYETLAPDAVDTVYLRNASTGAWNTVFSQTAAVAACINTLSISIATTAYNVDAIRIAVNSPAVANWNEIDAVSIENIAPMTYSSSTTTQNNTSTVGVSSTNNEVIGIQIVTTGTTSPLNATSFTLNTTGTTNAANDISNAKLWYTGTSSSFATTTQFGTTVAAPNGVFTITGTQALSTGTNYFWLSYDVTAIATVNNFIDGECTSLTVGSAHVPTVTAPGGSRQIAACGNTYTASQSSTYSTCSGTYANLTDGNSTTGAGTNSSANEWIEAAFSCPKIVSAVIVAGYTGCTFNSSYLNGALIQSSTDNITWTTRATISGVTDANGLNTFSVGCVTAQYWRIKQSGTNFLGVAEFSFTFSSSMQYSSSTVTQNNTAVVGKNTTNNEVIGIQIVTSGCASPFNATSFSLNTTGTTAPATDITNAKLWYTGTSSAFATTTQFGTTVAAPNGVFTITGTQALSEGTNYFWLTYDVPSGATANNFIDGECTSITVGTPRTPTVTAPAGNRKISPIAPPTFQCSSTNWGSCGSGPYIIAKPACVATNDLMIAHFSYATNTGDVGITPPAGWTQIFFTLSAGTSPSMTAFYKIATASEPATYSFSGTANTCDQSMAILVYRGVDVSNPIEASGSVVVSPGNISHTTPCIAATTDQSMIVALFATAHCNVCSATSDCATGSGGGGTTNNWTAPAGMTERYDYGGVQCSGIGHSANDVVQAAGGCAQKTATAYSSVVGVAAILTLRPSGATNTYTCSACVPSSLPVELLSFTAECEKNNSVKVQWRTATETNNDYFTIERSIDGKTFEPVGKVKGAGNSSTMLNYEFVDIEIPLSAITVYYRLKQTDFDGKYEYFAPASVHCLPDDGFLIYPNPANDNLTIEINLSEEANISIAFLNLLGQNLLSRSEFFSKGTHKLNFSLKEFTAGVYAVEIANGKTKTYHRIIISE